MNINDYFTSISDGVEVQYKLATQAKARGFDPVSKVEVPIATTLAEKAIGLISTIYPQLQDPKVIARILELEAQYGQLDTAVAFKIAEEIARETFCTFESLLQAMDAGIRVGFSYITLGVVSSPIEGFTQLEVKKTRDGKDYLAASFSGPIRSAGTTASCVVLMLIDYLRETFGFAPYDPTEDEVKRYVTENYDYHERVTNLQYLPTEEEIAFLAARLPIEITGEPTEQREVSNYKDLPRINSNLIRGGMCLIFSEGLAQKAQKGLRLLRSTQAKGFVTTGWDFLDEFLKVKEKREKGKTDSSPTYIKDLVAGRPVFSHPSRSGAFRFRYGRSRTNGFSAMCVHPATMAISGDFLSAGTQLKTEKPTKGCTITACDSIDGPIVKLRDGSVQHVTTYEEGKLLYPQVEEIVYFGDLLVSFGDVLNRNYKLLHQGFVEEWWDLIIKEKNPDFAIDSRNVHFEDAVRYSKEYEVPLHPTHIYYWREISYPEFLGLVDWIGHAKLNGNSLVLPYTQQDKERFMVGKRALELLGCDHKVTIENVVIPGESSLSLLYALGIVGASEASFDNMFSLQIEKIKQLGEKTILEIINSLCETVIKDKSGTFIGSRMGRPEKAKLRKLTGSPHTLFPVGEEGGRLRSFQSALEVGYVASDFPTYYCKTCALERIYPHCQVCGEMCVKTQYCVVCDAIRFGKCEEGHRCTEYKPQRLPIRELYDEAKKRTKVRIEEIPVVKGIRGTSSKDHSCEYLGKGLLRAKHGLNVNKDGTIRYDMTEMTLTHFKPKEIRTSIERLKELGYDHDIYGAPLQNDEQILEMFPHDIVLPVCPGTMDEPADKVFLKITQFIDDELEHIYGLPRFYNAKESRDILGALVVCIAPHICTATVGRLIGYSETQTLMASPYMHAAMRRDTDGDEAATMLLMDLLLNFSRTFLPAHRGGTQDAPLVLNTHINAGDVDDQILDFEMGLYPLALYELAEQGVHSSEVKVDSVKRRLKEGKDPFTGMLFTHHTSNFNMGVTNTAYKILPTMAEKVDKQMELCEKIRAVDTSDVARLIIERHFVRDTRGNLRKFSMQGFRCTACNEKYRRTPLAGKCLKCGGRIIFTISEGSILKYMQKSLDLARKYDVGAYLLESLELTQMYIQSIFGKEKEKQEALGKWF